MKKTVLFIMCVLAFASVCQGPDSGVAGIATDLEPRVEQVSRRDDA